MVDAGGAIQIVGVCSWVPLTGLVPRKSDADTFFAWHFPAALPGSSNGDHSTVVGGGFPSEEPFAILASKADQTYINGSVAFEAAPKSPY